MDPRGEADSIAPEGYRRQQPERFLRRVCGESSFPLLQKRFILHELLEDGHGRRFFAVEDSLDPWEGLLEMRGHASHAWHF